MCNLYSMTTNQAAIIELLRVFNVSIRHRPQATYLLPSRRLSSVRRDHLGMAGEIKSERGAREMATSGASVCAVARRHGLSPQQLFGWRRQLQEAHAEGSETNGLRFVAAVVDAAASSAPAICPQQNASRSTGEPAAGGIEVELGGVSAAARTQRW